ncbi:MAG: hypothetical protein ACRD26_23190 [Vicinamibacterales bacterium]
MSGGSPFIEGEPMLDWEMLMLLDEREDEDEATRYERRAFRQELQWSVSPLVFAAILLAHGGAALARLLSSRARRVWTAVRGSARRRSFAADTSPSREPLAHVHADVSSPIGRL